MTGDEVRRAVAESLSLTDEIKAGDLTPWRKVEVAREMAGLFRAMADELDRWADDLAGDDKPGGA